MKSFSDIIMDYASRKTSVYQTYRDLREFGYTFQEIRRIVKGILRSLEMKK